jgi:hypothetical protein
VELVTKQRYAHHWNSAVDSFHGSHQAAMCDEHSDIGVTWHIYVVNEFSDAVLTITKSPHLQDVVIIVLF